MANFDLEETIQGVINGRTDMLSRAITLVESTRHEDLALARELVETCLQHSGGALRLAISGVPGVGKSTFINALGQEFIRSDKKVAVLAIDPSSDRSKGSILGDKTRMAELAASDGAYIRPSPASGALGGVARNTYEAMLLCEAAGYDIVIIETVGVGQSETAVAQLADLFVLLALSTAGDELQGIKRGIMEQADLIVVNKADVAEGRGLKGAITDLKNAIHLFPENFKGFEVEVLSCSSKSGENIQDITEKILGLYSYLKDQDSLTRLRTERSVSLMDRILNDRILQTIKARISDTDKGNVEKDLKEGRTTPYQAVDALLKSILLHE